MAAVIGQYKLSEKAPGSYYILGRTIAPGTVFNATIDMLSQPVMIHLVNTGMATKVEPAKASVETAKASVEPARANAEPKKEQSVVVAPVVSAPVAVEKSRKKKKEKKETSSEKDEGIL